MWRRVDWYIGTSGSDETAASILKVEQHNSNSHLLQVYKSHIA
jgi:hypothetical protein